MGYGRFNGRFNGRWIWPLGFCAGTLALMAACGPGAPLPAVSPSPSAPAAPVVLPLPGIASAPPETAKAPEVILRSRELSQELDGWWRLEGRLVNAGELPAREVGLTARLYDAWGILLETREALLTPDRLEPGQEGRYLVTWPPERDARSVTLQPHWLYLPD